MSNPTYYPAHSGGNPQTVAAIGSSQGTAAPLVAGCLNLITGADGTVSCILPVALAGERLRVYSGTATNAVPVYAQTGGAINAGSVNASFSVTARKACEFECADGTNWIAILSA